MGYVVGLLFAFMIGIGLGDSLSSGKPVSIKRDVAYQTIAQDGQYAALKQVGRTVLRVYYLENEVILPPCFVVGWKKSEKEFLEIGCPK